MIVVTYKPGQLGNRLFYAAHLVAWARTTGQPAVFLGLDEYSAFFEGTCKNGLGVLPPYRGRSLPARARRVLVEGLQLIQRGLGRLPRGRDARGCSWSIGLGPWMARVDHHDSRIRAADPEYAGYLRAARFTFLRGWVERDGTALEHDRQVLLRFFQPRPFHRARVEDCLNRARHGVDLVAGVHIRRRDYASHLGGRYFFPYTVYRQAMDCFLRLTTGRVRFLICSDEPIPEEPFEGLDFLRGPGQLVEDMYSLAGCHYLLGPPSTFTLWASFYGEVPRYSLARPPRSLSWDEFRICRDRWEPDEA